MALPIGKSKNRGLRRAPMSDINVTPMIDVMLVLLIIFMVTAPFFTTGIKVNLPSAKASNIQGNDMPIIVHINKDEDVFIGDVKIDRNTLTEKLLAVTKENVEDVRIFVRGDQSLSYGQIMKIMELINGAGFRKVVLVTESPQEQRQQLNASPQR
ncbi:MAG: protein TolR [Holosporaceae bacterium]|jgi:biopolymer transport protein TolR|nr:protein TolR [Holosporaceae bacterium]